MIYHKSYKKNLRWHLLIDVIIVICMMISVNWIFSERRLYHIDFAIGIGISSFIHVVVLLFYFFGILFEQKWWAALDVLIHVVILFLFVICSY